MTLHTPYFGTTLYKSIDMHMVICKNEILNGGLFNRRAYSKGGGLIQKGRDYSKGEGLLEGGLFQSLAFPQRLTINNQHNFSIK